ncbi:hypothetical protein DFH06DRAFT_1366364 [Mycena polygramma]|nr:hypothetical protein DFH06DRAFT_1366364 [Mycena polygramma]
MSSDLPPTSTLYPKLVTIQRTLRGALHLLPYMDLPYGITEPGNPRVIFYEFRGRGPPPGDIGRPGDVYWDVTFPCIIYFVGTGGWEAWNPQASDGSQLLARNPNFANRYLWTSRHHHGFSWLTKESLAKSLLKTSEPQSINQDKLKHFLHFSPSTMSASLALNVADNQTRNDAEITRRRLNGVAIGVEAKQNQEHVSSAPKVECTDSSSGNLTVAFLQSELQERDKKPLLDAGQCIEGKLQNLKRKHEEDSQSASQVHEDLKARHAQGLDLAHRRIEELEEENKKASSHAQHKVEFLQNDMSQKETELLNELLVKLKATVATTFNDLEEKVGMIGLASQEKK